jgi:hypothetical protein
MLGHVVGIKSIGITGFRKSCILMTRRLVHSKSRYREKGSGPSIIGGCVAQIEAIGKSPERTAPSVNRRSGNRGVKRTRHQGSRSPDLRYPDKIWTVRSQKIWTIELSKDNFLHFSDLKDKEPEKPVVP